MRCLFLLAQLLLHTLLQPVPPFTGTSWQHLTLASSLISCLLTYGFSATTLKDPLGICHTLSHVQPGNKRKLILIGQLLTNEGCRLVDKGHMPPFSISWVIHWGTVYTACERIPDAKSSAQPKKAPLWGFPSFFPLSTAPCCCFLGPLLKIIYPHTSTCFLREKTG